MGKKHKRNHVTPIGWEQPVWMAGDNLPCPPDAKDAYFQCTLKRDGVTLVSWIERKFAVAGKPVRVKRDGVWEDGWHVESVGNVEHKEEVDRMSQRHKFYRDGRKV